MFANKWLTKHHLSVSVKLISKKMHEATFKLVLTQGQYVDRSY